MKFLLLSTLLLPIQIAYSAQANPVFKEKAPLDIGSFRGKATLTLNKTKFKVGEKFTADIRFLNQSGGDKFYNPFFNRLIPLPAKLAIFDGKKKFIGDLMGNTNGSRRSINPDTDRTYIEGSSYVGTKYPLTAGSVQGTKYDPFIGKESRKWLPVGRYYLQVIYNTSFVELGLRGYNTELFRSNVAEFQIVK